MVARLISSEITAMAWASMLSCTGPDASGNALSSPDRPPPGACQWLPISSNTKLMKDDSPLNRAGQLRAPA